MNIESNKIITKNESNENNQSHKIISSNVIDFLNLTESDKKKINKDENKSSNIKSIIGDVPILPILIIPIFTTINSHHILLFKYDQCIIHMLFV